MNMSEEKYINDNCGVQDEGETHRKQDEESDSHTAQDEKETDSHAAQGKKEMDSHRKQGEESDSHTAQDEKETDSHAAQGKKEMDSHRKQDEESDSHTAQDEKETDSHAAQGKKEMDSHGKQDEETDSSTKKDEEETDSHTLQNENESLKDNTYPEEHGDKGIELHGHSKESKPMTKEDNQVEMLTKKCMEIMHGVMIDYNSLASQIKKHEQTMSTGIDTKYIEEKAVNQVNEGNLPITRGAIYEEKNARQGTSQAIENNPKTLIATHADATAVADSKYQTKEDIRSTTLKQIKKNEKTTPIVKYTEERIPQTQSNEKQKHKKTVPKGKYKAKHESKKRANQVGEYKDAKEGKSKSKKKKLTTPITSSTNGKYRQNTKEDKISSATEFDEYINARKVENDKLQQQEKKANQSEKYNEETPFENTSPAKQNTYKITVPIGNIRKYDGQSRREKYNTTMTNQVTTHEYENMADEGNRQAEINHSTNCEETRNVEQYKKNVEDDKVTSITEVATKKDELAVEDGKQNAVDENKGNITDDSLTSAITDVAANNEDAERMDDVLCHAREDKLSTTINQAAKNKGIRNASDCKRETKNGNITSSIIQTATHKDLITDEDGTGRVKDYLALTPVNSMATFGDRTEVGDSKSHTKEGKLLTSTTEFTQYTNTKKYEEEERKPKMPTIQPTFEEGNLKVKEDIMIPATQNTAYKDVRKVEVGNWKKKQDIITSRTKISTHKNENNIEESKQIMKEDKVSTLLSQYANYINAKKIEKDKCRAKEFNLKTSKKGAKHKDKNEGVKAEDGNLKVPRPCSQCCEKEKEARDCTLKLINDNLPSVIQITKYDQTKLLSPNSKHENTKDDKEKRSDYSSPGNLCNPQMSRMAEVLKYNKITFQEASHKAKVDTLATSITEVSDYKYETWNALSMDKIRKYCEKPMDISELEVTEDNLPSSPSHSEWCDKVKEEGNQTPITKIMKYDQTKLASKIAKYREVSESQAKENSLKCNQAKKGKRSRSLIKTMNYEDKTFAEIKLKPKKEATEDNLTILSHIEIDEEVKMVNKDRCDKGDKLNTSPLEEESPGAHEISCNTSSNFTFPNIGVNTITQPQHEMDIIDIIHKPSALSEENNNNVIFSPEGDVTINDLFKEFNEGKKKTHAEEDGFYPEGKQAMMYDNEKRSQEGNLWFKGDNITDGLKHEKMTSDIKVTQFGVNENNQMLLTQIVKHEEKNTPVKEGFKINPQAMSTTHMVQNEKHKQKPPVNSKSCFKEDNQASMTNQTEKNKTKKEEKSLLTSNGTPCSNQIEKNKERKTSAGSSDSGFKDDNRTISAMQTMNHKVKAAESNKPLSKDVVTHTPITAYSKETNKKDGDYKINTTKLEEYDAQTIEEGCNATEIIIVTPRMTISNVDTEIVILSLNKEDTTDIKESTAFSSKNNLIILPGCETKDMLKGINENNCNNIKIGIKDLIESEALTKKLVNHNSEEGSDNDEGIDNNYNDLTENSEEMIYDLNDDLSTTDSNEYERDIIQNRKTKIYTAELNVKKQQKMKHAHVDIVNYVQRIYNLKDVQQYTCRESKDVRKFDETYQRKEKSFT